MKMIWMAFISLIIALTFSPIQAEAQINATQEVDTQMQENCEGLPPEDCQDDSMQDEDGETDNPTDEEVPEGEEEPIISE